VKLQLHILGYNLMYLTSHQYLKYFAIKSKKCYSVLNMFVPVCFSWTISRH